ncbi:acyl-CoA N-acyltransferase [Aspergillus egyptiacus]|nr:acyl-CoA N-acyltransferase [Aspergillus egyptiacus]
MKITTRPATRSDIPALAAINIHAFRNTPLHSNAFPNLPYDAVHAAKQQRYLRKLAHPETHVLAAVDESGVVVGCARWLIPGVVRTTAAEAGHEEKKEEEMLPEGTNREIYEGFFRVLEERGREFLREDDIVLEFLATHPDAQRKGVGKALLTWGMERADQLQRRIYLEATTEGLPVYEKLGWRELARVVLDYSRWGGEGGQELTLMVRDPGSPSLS